MKPLPLLLSLTALVCSCSRPADPPVAVETTTAGQTTASAAASRERALVRFVNADPHRVALDLWFEKEKVFSSVAFRDVTPYREVPASRQMFSIRTSGQMQELATNSEGLTDGRRYTFVAIMKPDGGTTLRATEDDLSANATGRPKLRLIHAAPNAGELTLIPTNRAKDPLFDDIDFQSTTSFKELGPSLTAFHLYRDDKKEEPALNLTQLNLQPDRFYTLVITGAKGSLESIRIEDQLSGPAAP
ncbi:MAG: DUF4397 domain-containing protein [Bryobacterales bacterium]|nr:DUF4397 domain-containing protein [Bryobacterales bacterium]